ncbi:MAG: NAD(P)/FAD-dependent oxidoreductase, partial [Gemmatimonadaceae bacterium]|nr:NAD(P)/FAD-dependent oxidoreductase [Gemmatimonadaceae bacterium]
ASAFHDFPQLVGIQPLARRIDRVRLEASADVFLDVALDDPLYVTARLILSRWQLERAVRAGASFEQAAVKRAERVDGGWILQLASGSARRVRRVIGADGAASTVRKAVDPGLRVELAPTRVIFAHGPGMTPDAIVMRFFRAIPGYAWNFPRPDHRSIGLGLEPGEWSRSRLDADLESYWDTWGRCECVPAVRAGAVIGTAFHAMRASYPEIGGSDFALLGDAAGFADPVTGEGIRNALRSAQMVAEAYAQGGSFSSYPRIAFAALEPEFRVARRMRRVLYAWDLPVRLIEAARRHSILHALLAAIVHGANEHDPRLWRSWWRELRRVRSPRAESAAWARIPVTLACGPEPATAHVPSRSTAADCAPCEPGSASTATCRM